MTNNLKNLIQIKKEELPTKKNKQGPKTPHQLLALEIAESFSKQNNRRDIAILMNMCKKYPKNYIRHIWGTVMEKNINNKMAYFLAIVKNKNELEKKEKMKNLKILFIGTSDFAVPTLKKLKEEKLNIISVITQPDKPSGRKKQLTQPPIKTLAQKYKLPIIQPKKIADITEKIIELKPDITVMVSYGQIISKKIIEIPKYGTLNIHPSILPKYRGSTPIQTAIFNQDKQTGISIIIVDEKMDHGPILNLKRIKIDNNDYPTISNKLANLGALLLIKIIPQYITGQLTAKEQNHQKATFTKILKRTDGKIDWSNSVKEIEAQIRAYFPWPGSWCYTNSNKKIKIIKASVYKDNEKNNNPGTIINQKNKMSILCGKGILLIEKIQLEGKNITTGENFLRGNHHIKTFK